MKFNWQKKMVLNNSKMTNNTPSPYTIYIYRKAARDTETRKAARDTETRKAARDTETRKAARDTETRKAPKDTETRKAARAPGWPMAGNRQ